MRATARGLQEVPEARCPARCSAVRGGGVCRRRAVTPVAAEPRSRRVASPWGWRGGFRIPQSCHLGRSPRETARDARRRREAVFVRRARRDEPPPRTPRPFALSLSKGAVRCPSFRRREAKRAERRPGRPAAGFANGAGARPSTGSGRTAGCGAAGGSGRASGRSGRRNGGQRAAPQGERRPGRPAFGSARGAAPRAYRRLFPAFAVFPSAFISGIAPEPGCRFACALRSASWSAGRRW